MWIKVIVHGHLIKHWVDALETKHELTFMLSSLSQYPKNTTNPLHPPTHPNVQPALTSVLMDITALFLHLCTQSVLAWGKVSHKYILKLHCNQPQIGEIINTTAQWSSLCRNQFNQAAVTGNCLLWSIIGCVQVCLPLNSHSCEASATLKTHCLSKLENSHILAQRGWDKENKSLVRIDFSILENKLEPHTHIHMPKTGPPPIDPLCQ